MTRDLGRRHPLVRFSRAAATVALAAWLCVAPLQPLCAAIPDLNDIPAPPRMSDQRDHDPATAQQAEPIREDQAGAYGCLLSGTFGAAYTLLAGANEIVMLAGGSSTMAPSSVTVWAVVFGVTMFLNLCTIGALSTPAVLRMRDYLDFHYFRPDWKPPAGDE